MYRKSYIEINEDSLIDNIKNIKHEYSDYKYYFAVVKANSYGHGECLINDMIKAGINYLAVSSLEEALSVREYNKDIPVLCFGYISPDNFDIVVQNNITITIISYDYFKEVVNTKHKIKAHLKLNTGMNRLGVADESQVSEIVSSLKNSNIKLEGIYTHFATSGVSDLYWDKQLNKFEELTKNINLDDIEIVHLYNSLSLVKHDKYKYSNGVRIGFAMYGFSSSVNISPKKLKLINLKKKIKFIGKTLSETHYSNNLKLKKVLKVYSRVININNIKRGEAVGYGAKYVAKKDTKIAVVEIGHADGITEAYKDVKINEKIYPIVAVCMDYIMVEVDNSIKLFDKVSIIDDDLTISKVASQSNDSVHHVLVSLSNRLPRVYVKNNK